jgi:hypothetical protein
VSSRTVRRRVAARWGRTPTGAAHAVRTARSSRRDGSARRASSRARSATFQNQKRRKREGIRVPPISTARRSRSTT